LGSTSILKWKAVTEAFPGQTVYCEEVVSCVPEQPVGKQETEKGAIWRAQKAFEGFKQKGKHVDIAIGIENGMFLESDGKWYDIAAIVILSIKGNDIVESTTVWSDVLQIPDKFVKACTNEKGEIFDVWHQSKDPHIKITNGIRSRKDFLCSALCTWSLHRPQ